MRRVDAGVVIAPSADDLHVELFVDKPVIGRSVGLTLSSSLQSVPYGTVLRPVTSTREAWGLDRNDIFGECETQQAPATAAASPGKRSPQRADLAVSASRARPIRRRRLLDVSRAEDHVSSEDVNGMVLRAITDVIIIRLDAGLQHLADPGIGDQHDAPLRRAMGRRGPGQMGHGARSQFEAGGTGHRGLAGRAAARRAQDPDAWRDRSGRSSPAQPRSSMASRRSACRI